mgnify:CR=1 FL=1
MMFKTHLAFGLLVGLIAITIYQTNHKILFFSLVLLFSAFPDIDTHKSKLGKRFPLISRILELVFGHRVFFHSIFPPLILGGIFFITNLNFIAVPIVLGYLSHLVADGFTKQGTNFLHPISTLSLHGFVETGGWIEFIIFILLIITDFIIIVY